MVASILGGAIWHPVLLGPRLNPQPPQVCLALTSDQISSPQTEPTAPRQADFSRREGRAQGCPKVESGARAEDFCPRIHVGCPHALPDPCQNHHCKHGKVCELDENNTPMCVCQDPTSCPAPIGEFEKVRPKGQGGG